METKNTGNKSTAERTSAEGKNRKNRRAAEVEARRMAAHSKLEDLNAMANGTDLNWTTRRKGKGNKTLRGRFTGESHFRILHATKGWRYMRIDRPNVSPEVGFQIFIDTIAKYRQV